MSRISSADDIRQLGTILSIWAHPDDETFSCAAIMAAAAAAGQRVVCVTATKGEAGVRDEMRWPKEKLGYIRAAELRDALGILGIREHRWLDYSDGYCSRANQEEAIARVASIVEEIKPDSILTFGPDGMTGHDDHKTISAWATAAAKAVGKKPDVYYAVELQETYDRHLKKADELFNIYFNTEKPPLCQKGECDICYCLTDEECELKRRAMEAMPSQTEEILKHFDKERFKEVFCCESFKLAD